MSSSETSPEPDCRLDATGLACPEPVFRARLALAPMNSGQRLEVRADDPLAALDFEVFCDSGGHEMESREQADGVFRFVIRKR